MSNYAETAIKRALTQPNPNGAGWTAAEIAEALGGPHVGQATIALRRALRAMSKRGIVTHTHTHREREVVWQLT